jgi:Sec-independent protein translocase protein TatA
METALFIIIIIVLFIFGVIILPQFMLRRAVKQVVKIFRRSGATSKSSARTLKELGIKPQGLFSLNFGLRDYKYYAVQALMKSEMIQEAEEGKLFLREEKLMHSLQ